MNHNNKCACDASLKLIFTCSGASDVVEIADRAARKLSRESAGDMFCLAGIGGRVSGITETTRTAAKVPAIDGCPLSCARQCLELAGFAGFMHLQLEDKCIYKVFLCFFATVPLAPLGLSGGALFAPTALANSLTTGLLLLQPAFVQVLAIR
ncbi:MAG: putative zinc-binding protein [Acidobacteria bacterium]|nr:putative zinc-binding protein [Acidobacteriota bacterium]